MTTSMCIGRIGGLAVALGVGAAVFTVCDGTAWAKGAADHTGTSASHHEHAKRVTAVHPRPKKTTRSSGNTATSRTAPSAVATAAKAPEGQITDHRSTAKVETKTETTESATAAATPTPTSASVAATVASSVASSVTTTTAATSAGTVTTSPPNAPTAPVDAVAAVTVLAVTRQQKTAAATVAKPAITTDPTLTFDDGIIEGSANAVADNGDKLVYTIIKGPSQGGKITFDTELAAGDFTYLPNSTVLNSGSETFREMISETTTFDKMLESIPLLGSFVPAILLQLHETAGLNSFLAPLIGASTMVTFTADPSELDPTGSPIAFTTKVKSSDGTLISTNFFPAAGLQSGLSAPTILEGPGLGSDGVTDPYSTDGILDIPGLVPGVATLRDAGYNVVTWDPRGEGASGGTLQLDNPSYEGKDVSSIITYTLSLAETKDNQRIGMVGGSYGGGIQLTSAVIDPRIDAIVPGIAWNTLNASLYPSGAFKTSWATLLILDLLEAGARINPQIYGGILTGFLTGYLTSAQQALLKASGPGSLVGDITVPTLLLQGTADGLFPLDQAILNEEALTEAGTTVKMVWFCGGHGICLDPSDQAAQTALLTTDTLDWLDEYVAQDSTAADALPNFQWIDQNGNLYSSNEFPNDASFQGTPVTASIKNGGTMPIIPILGGSGPSPKVGGSLTEDLLSTATASPASNAINLKVSVAGGTQIVGSPTVTFTYSGLGNGRDIYAQIVDDQTNRVLGNIVTPVPVILDGQTHTVTVSLNDIAYTAAVTGGLLTLQLVGSATQYQNFTSVGAINVSNVSISLPTVGTDVATEQDRTPVVV
jgi:ABC-2 type transport system ATP-binding protein